MPIEEQKSRTALETTSPYDNLGADASNRVLPYINYSGYSNLPTGARHTE